MRAAEKPMPKKPRLSNMEVAQKKRIAEMQAKYKADEELRQNILKRNASKATELAENALKAIREYNALEQAMAAEAPEIEPSFITSSSHIGLLTAAESALGAVVDETKKFK